MKNRRDPDPSFVEKLLGLGVSSTRKTYYPQLQQRLMELERLKACVDHSNDAIFVIDVPSGHITDVNQSATVQMGWSREEFLGLSLFAISELKKDPSVQDLMQLTTKSERDQGRAVTFLVRKNGEKFPVEVSLDRIQFYGDNYVMVVARDITERVHAEGELRESEQRYRFLNQTLEQRIQQTVDELEQNNRLLLIQSRQAVMGEMISNIAHQWRQPLNTLALVAQELQISSRMGKCSPDLIDANVRKTLEVLKQMSRTIDDFRYFFKQSNHKEAFRAGDVVEKTLSLLGASLAELSISLKVETTEDHPVVYGYPNEFSQVLLNILSNARDAFVANNVPAPLVTITLKKENDKAIVTVSDNAGGIPEQIIDKVFEPYFTTKGPDHGTGIGLFMCKTIIEKNMNGAISVRNVGEGAEFRIELECEGNLLTHEVVD